jgi:hypothetical protein
MSRLDPRATCETCAHWHPVEGHGLCRRVAPRDYRTPVMTTDRVAIWPETLSDDWCGEHLYAMRRSA